jgi:hypothetical protein
MQIFVILLHTFSVPCVLKNYKEITHRCDFCLLGYDTMQFGGCLTKEENFAFFGVNSMR